MRYVILASVLSVLATTPAVATGIPDQDQTPTSRQQSTERSAKVDLNTADQQTLESLPGIGPRTAELIIAYRDEVGGFKKLEELMNVKGIGERTFLRLRELVVVAGVDGGS